LGRIADTRQFATVSTKALGQKSGGTMPAFVVRLVMGEMGEEFLLASRRAFATKNLAVAAASSVPALRTVRKRWIRAPRRNDGVEHVPDEYSAIHLPQMM